MINSMPILKSFGFSEESNFASLVIFIKFYDFIIFMTGKFYNDLLKKMQFKADKFAANIIHFLGD
jgi:hypothetical protein